MVGKLFWWEGRSRNTARCCGSLRSANPGPNFPTNNFPTYFLPAPPIPSFPAAIRILAYHEPARAAELFSKQSTAQPDAELAERVAASWTGKDAPAAAQWAQGLPAGEVRQKAFVGIISGWAHADPAAAGQWLQRLPASSEKDSAISGFAWEVFERDPDAALAWIESVGDPFFRDVQFKAITTRWMKDDPEGAKKWIQSTNQLSPAAKKEMLAPSTQTLRLR